MNGSTILRLTLAALLSVVAERASSQQVLIVPAEPDDSGPVMGVVMPSGLDSLHERNKDTLARDGYIERSDQAPRARYIEDRMTERRAAARLKGADENPTELGYYDLARGNIVDFSELSFYPTLLPSVYMGSSTRSYLLLGGHGLKQLHTGTAFGTLIVDEIDGAHASFFSSNLRIGGEPAVITDIRYRENVWATAIYATRNDRLFIVETDARMEGERREDFVSMVEDLVLRAVD